MKGGSRLAQTNAALWGAVIVLLAFGGLVVWMLGQRSTNDIAWSRLTYVYGSVEAIVFAAAGALFGTQVQRQSVKASDNQRERAEGRADQAEAEQKRLAIDATRGQALAASVRGMYTAASSQSRQDRGGSVRGDLGPAARTPPGTEPETVALAQLRAVADELFPVSGKPE